MREPLGDKAFDDGLTRFPRAGSCAVRRGPSHRGGLQPRLSGGGDLRPGNDDVVGIEPMAAPTNALRKGNYNVAVPGRPASASFTIKV